MRLWLWKHSKIGVVPSKHLHSLRLCENAGDKGRKGDFNLVYDIIFGSLRMVL